MEARIFTAKSAKALQIPASALVRHDGGLALFTVQGERVQLTKVELGKNNGLQVEIASGISAASQATSTECCERRSCCG